MTYALIRGEEMLTIAEARNATKVTIKRIRHAIRHGQLDAYERGGTIYVSLPRLRRFQNYGYFDFQVDESEDIVRDEATGDIINSDSHLPIATTRKRSWPEFFQMVLLTIGHERTRKPVAEANGQATY